MVRPRVRRSACLAGVAIVGLVLLPAAAGAQTLASGGIAGAVRDTSGAVLPGVTVEAASPALIEKVRTVVTDSQGRYNIVDLRPGVYTVTFTLPGFASVRREGIELTTAFTATVNADLRVGTVEETITVTGTTPIVDTQNVRSQTALSHEYLEAVPTGKANAAYLSLILGATGPLGDVGGSKGDNVTAIAINGNRPGDQLVMVDGMRYNYFLAQGGGPARQYAVNQFAIEEMVLETSGISAESATGGIQQNAVPKDGGNTFSLIALGNYTGPSLATENLTDELRARGLRTPNSVRHIYDSGMGLGGPFKQDTLWFYTAHRSWGTSEYIGGNYFNKSVNSLFYTPDLTRPAYIAEQNQAHGVRLTWQAAPKHKLTVSTDYERICLCYSGVAANRSPESTIERWFNPVYLTQATWSYPASNRVLVQVGVTYGNNLWSNKPVKELSPDAISVTELSTGYIHGALPGGALNFGNYGYSDSDQINTRASVSYITGSHAFKVGSFFHIGVPDGMFANNYVQNDVTYAFRKPTPDAAPVPVSVTQWASPNVNSYDAYNVGLYAQDQWALRRFTLNLGVRFDRFHGSVPAQTRPAGRFVPEFSFQKVDNVPSWKDVSPRLGVAYDLFGDGKTAIKTSLGRYVIGEGGGVVSANSPASVLVLAATRVWNDVNRDYVPQESELGPLSNSAFGTVVRRSRYADKVLQGWGVRPYNWQGSVSLQQELRPGVGVTVSYFRTSYGNSLTTDNLNVTPADYSPYCVTAPVDARLPGGGGNQICGLYDISPTAFGSVDNVVTSASDFGKLTEVYNGVEASVSARFGRGGTVSGGVAKGKTGVENCFVVDSPQELYQCKATTEARGTALPGANISFNTPVTQVKFNGAYPLPWDLQVSAVFQNVNGPPILADLVYTNAQIAPSLGRNLGACGGRTPCTATAAVRLIEPGTMFEDRYTQLDLRLTKTIRMGRARVQGMLDVYNALNSSFVTSRNNTYGPTWGLPTSMQLGRLFKFGAQLDW